MALNDKTYEYVTGSKRYRIKRGKVETPRPIDHVYRKNTPYQHVFLSSTGEYVHNGNPVINARDTAIFTRIYLELPRLQEIAMHKFRQKAMGDQAGLGINIVQWRQSLDMIANRAGQITRFAKKLPGLNLPLLAIDLVARKRALNALRRTLRAPANSAEFKRLQRYTEWQWRNRIRTPGDLFLEFWFGWSPFVGDIMAAVDILQGVGDHKVDEVTLRASARIPYFRVDGERKPFPLSWSVTRITAQVSVGVYGRVIVENPNLHLANRLGLVNLPSILLDAVPFSWLVGWFANLNQFVSALSWDAGLNLDSQNLGRGVSIREYRADREICLYGKTHVDRGSAGGFERRRELLAPAAFSELPKLRLRKPQESYTRALTATSFLLKSLSRF